MQSAATRGNRETERDRGFASRVTISPTGTEDLMARGCTHGTGSALSSSQDFVSYLRGHFRFASVHTLMGVFSRATFLLLAACLASALCVPLLAQQDDTNQVHVTPRVQHDQPKGPAATTDA